MSTGGLPRVEKLLPVGQEWIDHLRSCGYLTRFTCGPPTSCGDSNPSCIHPGPPVNTPHPSGVLSSPPRDILTPLCGHPPPPGVISPPPGDISPPVDTSPPPGVTHPLLWPSLPVSLTSQAPGLCVVP
ncbi:hypothetical protein P7K49_023551 [Saguinus oedipus]|uniref:Uncharacterized protein n=1 Tax=Saguinus oedipus TaxID=9490 RepID=A0ABQ9UMQ5_SAGOE|nr:hypothetical protein P7K49_023551 [Saguinus oedipus]